VSEQKGLGLGRRIATVALLCCALVAVAAAPALAQKPGGEGQAKADAAGQLDAGFGNGGKVTVAFPAGFTGSNGPQYSLPFSFTPGHLEMAQAPGGKVVVAGAGKIVRYTAKGQLDTSFGSGGTVRVPRPPGAVFVLAAVGVDSVGRVVLAGVSRPLPPNSTPDPVLSSAALMRFNADGSLDSSFGSGGVLITNFGAKAPKAGGGSYPGTSVGLADIAIDSQNRIVVTGGVVTQLSTCRSSVDSEGFVARLSESGAIDPTFGFHLVEGLARVGQIAPRSSGYLALASGGPLCEGKEGPASVMIGIDSIGNLDSGFASFGFRTLPFREAPALTIAPSGKILLLGRPESRRVYRKGEEGKKVRVTISYQVVQRLLPSGAADPGFSRVGKITYRDPKSGAISDLTVDGKERIYLAGKVSQKVTSSRKKALLRTRFLLTRLNPGGATDRSFGKRGVVSTGFGGTSNSFATQVMLDAKGRILVGGGISSPQLPSGGGYALARYLSGK
jgi:uncharacterized delta-60 repeat protein